MAHFKCTSCHARIWRDGPAETHARDLCPGCGGPLETVTRVEEIVGLRALRTRPHAHRSLADQVREAIAHNDAARRRRLASVRTDPPPDAK